MSNEDFILEQIYEDVDMEEKDGLLTETINQVAKDHNLHADDDLEEIKEIIAEERYEERSYEQY